MTAPDDAIAFRYFPREKCPDRDWHHSLPDDFDLDRVDAAGGTEPSLTHVQRRCPTCLLWTQWEPRGGPEGDGTA